MRDGDGREQPAGDGGAARREIARMRDFVQDLRMEDLRDGVWFAKLLAFSLTQYVKEVDAGYFREKYPHLPADAVVQARIKMAARYASIEGGLSASAYTGAVAATVGTGGAASPLSVSGGVASFALDLTYTSQLQLRLAHDIAILYRVPLNLNDPDDLWKLIRIAFGIKAGELASGGALKAVPMVVRPLVRKIFSGTTLTAVKSLPLIGKYLLQRNLIKFAIPAVGVPLTAGGNYWVTRVAGEHAQNIFRNEARVIETASRLTRSTSDHEALLWALWLIIQADGKIHDNERLLLHHVTMNVREVSPSLRTLADLRDVVDLDEAIVISKLEKTTEDPSPVFDAAAVAAVIDGHLDRDEIVILKTLADRCGSQYDEGALRKRAKGWT